MKEFSLGQLPTEPDEKVKVKETEEKDESKDESVDENKCEKNDEPLELKPEIICEQEETKKKEIDSEQISQADKEVESVLEPEKIAVQPNLFEDAPAEENPKQQEVDHVMPIELYQAQISNNLKRIKANTLRQRVSTGKKFMGEVPKVFKFRENDALRTLEWLTRIPQIDIRTLAVPINETHKHLGKKYFSTVKWDNVNFSLDKYLEWGLTVKFGLPCCELYGLSENGRNMASQEFMQRKLHAPFAAFYSDDWESYREYLTRAAYAQYGVMAVMNEKSIYDKRQNFENHTFIISIKGETLDAESEVTVSILIPYFAGLDETIVWQKIQDLKATGNVILVVADKKEIIAPWLQYFGEDSYAFLTQAVEGDKQFFNAEGQQLDFEAFSAALESSLNRKNEMVDDEDADEEQNAEAETIVTILPADKTPDVDDKTTPEEDNVAIEDSANNEIAAATELENCNENSSNKAPEQNEKIESPTVEDTKVELTPDDTMVAQKDSEKQENVISEDEIPQKLAYISEVFKKGLTGTGMALLHLLKKNSHSLGIQELCDEVGYLLDDPCAERQFYGSDFSFWDTMLEIPGTNTEIARDYLNAFSMMKCFFNPDPYDYQIGRYWNQLKDNQDNVAFQQIPELKQIISLFKSFIDYAHASFAACYSKKVQQQETLATREKNILRKIDNQRQLLENTIHKNVPHPRIKELQLRLYSPKGIVYPYFKDIKKASLEDMQTFCENFMEKPLSSSMPLPLPLNCINEQKIADYLNEIWSSIDVKTKKNDAFVGTALNTQTLLLKKSVGLLAEYWLCKQKRELITQQALSIEVSENQKKDAKKLFQLIRIKARQMTIKEPIDELIACVLGNYLSQFGLILNEKEQNPEWFYDDFLKTTYIELNDEFKPELGMDYGIHEYSAEERIHAHVGELQQDRTWQEAYQLSLDTYNFKTAEQIVALHEDACTIRSDLKDLKDLGLEYLQNDEEKFRGFVELAANYGKILGNDRVDAFLHISEDCKQHFTETGNYGMYKNFLNACKQSINESASIYLEEKKREFEQLKKHLQETTKQEDEETPDFSCLDKIQKALDDNNLTVAEDYLNHCHGKNLQEVQGFLNNTFDNNVDVLQTFLAEYQNYYDGCVKNKSYDLKRIYNSWPAAKGRRLKSRIYKDGDAFIDSWEKAISVSVEPFLANLGFEGEPQVKKEKNETGNRIVYTISYKKVYTVKESYAHTFALFGSNVYRTNGLKIVAFTGAHSPENLVNELAQADLKTANMGVLCLVDSALKLADRRQLAMLMKTNPAMANVLVIDRVMALYLTKFEKIDRLNKMLELALPFSYVQPFIEGANIPPEMFVGRQEELAQIRKVDGPVLVYGGRQLGKSALLRQACAMENNPQVQSYGIYLDIKTLDADETLKNIWEKLKDANIVQGRISSWNEFGTKMSKVLHSDSPIQKVLLLLDEADAFIQSCNEMSNRPIEILKSIRDDADGRFKFVLAGLHNVVRFDHEQLGGNSVYAQLGHIVVRPFTFPEASELLLKPLRYLGFEIEKPTIINTIFSKANYFPGLIQFYGKSIVEAVRENYKHRILKTKDAPPYQLDEEFLTGLLKKDDFLKNIDDKLDITLRLDEDRYYYIIALCTAYGYFMEGHTTPITAEMIQEICQTYQIKRMSSLSLEKINALMGELVDLNILRKFETGYIFTRHNFFTMMGTEEDVERKLEEYGE